MTSIKLRDGDITLYHRRDSKNWQADIRLHDGGRHTLSLRTANEKVAKDKVMDLQQRPPHFGHRWHNTRTETENGRVSSTNAPR